MQIYYPSLLAIEQQTRQLANLQCGHCEQTQHLVSHGFIRKKQSRAAPAAVGKRVFCSNRNSHTGCGRTMQLYVDSTIRYLHYAGACVVAFLLSLIAGLPIQTAYHQATGAATHRNAYRWLDRLCAQLSTYRSLRQQPPLQDTPPINAANRPCPVRPVPSERLLTLIATGKQLLQQFGQPLCSAYQAQLQRAFL